MFDYLDTKTLDIADVKKFYGILSFEQWLDAVIEQIPQEEENIFEEEIEAAYQKSRLIRNSLSSFGSSIIKLIRHSPLDRGLSGAQKSFRWCFKK